jgi:hypothetical protein
LFLYVGNVFLHKYPLTFYMSSGSLDGIEMLAFLELSKWLNFTWQLHEPSGNWGHFRNGTWIGGLFGGLASGALDIVFCTLWIVEEQMALMDYVVPWNQICNTFLVPRSGATLTWRSVFLTLDAEVWAVLGLSVLVTSLALFILVQLRRAILQPLIKPHSEFSRFRKKCINSLQWPNTHIGLHASP